MTEPPAVPVELDGSHVLAVPRGTDLLPLAHAWFPTARWVREPAPVAVARPVTGARFRGIAVAAAAPAGALRLGDGPEVTGPYPLAAADARVLGLPARDCDLYGVPAPPVAGADPGQVAGWLVAAARRTGGGILPAARDRAVVPDPAAAVDLSLWSPVELSAADAVPLLRPALPGSRATPPQPGADGGFTLTATYPYDGAVVVTCARATEVPVVLSTLDRRTHGPWGYRVVWHPPDPLALSDPHPSQLHVVARQRVAPAVARAVAALWRAAGGTVVDAGGFVLTPGDVEARTRV